MGLDCFCRKIGTGAKILRARIKILGPNDSHVVNHLYLSDTLFSLSLLCEYLKSICLLAKYLQVGPFIFQ